MKYRKTRLVMVLMSVFFLLSVGTAFGQEKPEGYPERNIEMYVGAGPGGGSDIFARTISIQARRALKNPLVIINMPGGGGAVAAEYIQTKPADGYTLLAGTLLALTEAPPLGMVKYSYEDWQPVIRVQYDTTMLVGLEGGKFKDIQEVIADAKAHPGQQSWGVVGTITGFNAICARQFTEAKGIDVKLVPFDRTGKQHAALLGGHIDAILEEPGVVSELMAAKKVRPLMVFAEERIRSFENVPTTKELGANAFMGLYRGIAVKKGTPKPIVDYLHEVFKSCMETDFYLAYEKSSWLDLRPGYLGPEEFDKFMRNELETYIKEFKKYGVYKPQK